MYSNVILFTFARCLTEFPDVLEVIGNGLKKLQAICYNHIKCLFYVALDLAQYRP